MAPAVIDYLEVQKCVLVEPSCEEIMKELDTSVRKKSNNKTEKLKNKALIL